MKLSKPWTCMLALLLLLAAPAAAQDDAAAEYDRVGFYLSAQGQFAFQNFASLTESKALSNIVDSLGSLVVPGGQGSDAWGAGARVGFRTSPRVAIEAEFEWLDEFRLQSRVVTPAGVAQTTIGTLTGFTTTANAKVFILTGRLQPYVIGGIGAGFMRSEPRFPGKNLNSVGFVGQIGGGGDVYLTEHIALFAEATYVFTSGNISDLDFIPIALGVTWRF